MNLSTFFANAQRVLLNPHMLYKWIYWQRRHLGWSPQIQATAQTEIRGFESFSEYYSADSLLPSSEERRFIDRYTAKSGIIFDVGANLGVFTAVLSELRQECRIFSVEPSPKTFEKLRQNVQSNAITNVFCHEIAFGVEAGRMGFVDDRKSPATNRLASKFDALRGDHVIEVLVGRLDDFCRDHEVERISFIKIDVEGFEQDVLEGGLRMFAEQRIDLGLIEVCPGNLVRLGRSPAGFLASIAAVGCELRAINADGSIGSLMTEDVLCRVSLTNGALIPHHRLAELMHHS